MKNKSILAFILILLFAGAKAQEHASLPDTSSAAKHKPKNSYDYVLNLDNRYSFITQNVVNIFGLKAGIEINEKWRFGLGYYNILFPLNVNYRYQGNLYPAKLSFWYVSLFAERVIVHRKKYELSIPFSYGIGTSDVIRIQSAYNGPAISTRKLTLVELSFVGYYKLANWIGPGVGVGYRLRMNSNPRRETAFNAPIYIVRVQIFLDELYDDLFPHGIRHRKSN